MNRELCKFGAGVAAGMAIADLWLAASGGNIKRSYWGIAWSPKIMVGEAAATALVAALLAYVGWGAEVKTQQ